MLVDLARPQRDARGGVGVIFDRTVVIADGVRSVGAGVRSCVVVERFGAVRVGGDSRVIVILVGAIEVDCSGVVVDRVCIVGVITSVVARRPATLAGGCGRISGERRSIVNDSELAGVEEVVNYRIDAAAVSRTPPVLLEVDVDVVGVIDADASDVVATHSIVQEAVAPRVRNTAPVLTDDHTDIVVVLDQVVLKGPSLEERLYADSVVLNDVAVQHPSTPRGGDVVVFEQAVADIDALCRSDAPHVMDEGRVSDVLVCRVNTRRVVHEGDIVDDGIISSIPADSNPILEESRVLDQDGALMTASDANSCVSARDNRIAHHEIDIEVVGLELDAAPPLRGGGIRAVDGEHHWVGCCAEHVQVATNIEPPARGEFDDDAFLDGQGLVRHDDQHVIDEIRISCRGPGLVCDDVGWRRRSCDGSNKSCHRYNYHQQAGQCSPACLFSKCFHAHQWF